MEYILPDRGTSALLEVMKNEKSLFFQEGKLFIIKFI